MRIKGQISKQWESGMGQWIGVSLMSKNCRDGLSGVGELEEEEIVDRDWIE